MQQTDIAIVGAGPTGAATALRLSYLGISSILLDKSEFPRDKVCGDALSGKVPTLLNRLDPSIMDRFRGKFRPTDVWGIRFVGPNRRLIELPFKVGYERVPSDAPGYVCKRMDFDHFLITEVERRENIDLRLGVEISAFSKTKDGYEIRSSDGSVEIACKLLIDASGAHSSFARKEAGLEKDAGHHAGAVRAYYEGVTGFHPDNFIELHFLDEYTPGYFWLFPLPNGQANIGLGMRTDYVKDRKINLRAELDKVVQTPAFKDRFASARKIGKTVGYGLPLGSKPRKLSGDNYLLTGDAGHLIDPLSGEGIGNGIYSGFIAAELAEKCIAANRFDAAFLGDYDVRIERVLRKEMRLSYQLQRMLSYRWLTNFLGSVISGNPKLIELLCRMYSDLELRKKLTSPLFWVRQIGRKRRNQRVTE